MNTRLAQGLPLPQPLPPTGGAADLSQPVRPVPTGNPANEVIPLDWPVIGGEQPLWPSISTNQLPLATELPESFNQLSSEAQSLISYSLNSNFISQQDTERAIEFLQKYPVVAANLPEESVMFITDSPHGDIVTIQLPGEHGGTILYAPDGNGGIVQNVTLPISDNLELTGNRPLTGSSTINLGVGFTF